MTKPIYRMDDIEYAVLLRACDRLQIPPDDPIAADVVQRSFAYQSMMLDARLRQLGRTLAAPVRRMLNRLNREDRP